MTEQLARYEVSQMAETERAATALFQSKFFSDVTSQAQAIVKVMAGAEIGIGPFASMNGIHVIQGKPTYGANILAAKVKGSGKYDYRVIEISEKTCILEFLQGGKEIGKSTFTIEDARKSGTKNIDKFPRNMLFARAMSNGIKWFCPDVLGGVTAYVPEEFDAVVDDNGAIVIDAVIQPEPVKEAPRQTEAQNLAALGFVDAPAAKSGPAANDDANVKGFINPPMLVEMGLSKDIPAAAAAITKLKLAGKKAAESLPIVRKYRSARDAGMTTDEAAAEAVK